MQIESTAVDTFNQLVKLVGVSALVTVSVKVIVFFKEMQSHLVQLVVIFTKIEAKLSAISCIKE